MLPFAAAVALQSVLVPTYYFLADDAGGRVLTNVHFQDYSTGKWDFLLYSAALYYHGSSEPLRAISETPVTIGWDTIAARRVESIAWLYVLNCWPELYWWNRIVYSRISPAWFTSRQRTGWSKCLQWPPTVISAPVTAAHHSSRVSLSPAVSTAQHQQRWPGLCLDIDTSYTRHKSMDICPVDRVLTQPAALGSKTNTAGVGYTTSRHRPVELTVCRVVFLSRYVFIYLIL